MSVYAPQVGCDEVVKDKFWQEFDMVVMSIPQSEEIYIGGDFNGHVGRANVGYERIHGGWGFGQRNREGETLLEAASAFDLAIANTFFQKLDQHLITYKSGPHSTQIDYFLLRRNSFSTAKDCKVIPGEPLVSQHRLMLLKICIKLKTAISRPKPLPKTKWINHFVFGRGFGPHSTQIDYFLLRRNSFSTAKDCKVIPGEPLVSQHRLMLLKICIKLKTAISRPKPLPKTKWFMLEKKECADEFQKRVTEKMIDMEDDIRKKSANECWNEMASCVRSVATNVFGESKGKRMIDKDTWWWNEEVQRALKEKKDAFKDWKSVDICNPIMREEKRKVYNESKKQAKKAVAIARGKVQDNLYKSLETPQGQKQLYRLAKAREINGRDITKIKCIKDESGKVLTADEDIKGRWKMYFEKLMNEENDWSKEIEEVPRNLGMIRKVSIDEVRKAVMSMKNGRAVGPDGIPSEVWKFLKEDGCKWLTLFFNKLLQEEIIPDEWCNSTLVPIYKNKGDAQECNNYRGIKLMSHSMKIWEKVIERRIREECEVTQNQFGFMPGRGTTDAIFALRQLCEKFKHAHKNLHMVFIDLEKAYDRVPRKVLWWALRKKNLPEKYVRIVCSMYESASTHVRSEAGLTDKFSVAVGLHQGSALSPFLFLLVLDALTAEIQGEAPWCMLFADDIVLVGEDAAGVQSRLEQWRERLEKVGLKISRTKTEHLYCDFGGPSNFSPIALNGVSLPVCSDFKYLGSLIQSDGEIDRDVNNRINAGWMKWRQVSGTTCDPKMPLKLKGKIYKTVIRPVVNEKDE
ncbi:uncharacterized protein LOC142976811 [Anticarsia gemmatalis]|uniref:uncharacterized protein LOC142976811 n=1 Tax=Anticarsia gemmatalis TaxID=129554 RepID=UPI003F75F396